MSPFWRGFRRGYFQAHGLALAAVLLWLWVRSMS